jgi:polyribonucleotide nucleotidyltransferase
VVGQRRGTRCKITCIFQMQVTEAMERDKRRKNIMIMGVPEQDEEKTKEFVKVLLDDLLKEEVEHTVVGRVGRVDGAKVRPVRIIIEKADMKRNILKHASMLKAEPKYEKVYVSPDLTRMQQEEDKKLRDKVKEYRRQGMTGVKISRGEVVREEDSGRVVLFSQTK